MNIKQSAWHFKFNLWFKSGSMWKMPKTLCGYFWTTVIHIIMVLLIVGFVGSAAWMFGIPFLTEVAAINALIVGLSSWVINAIAVIAGAIIFSIFAAIVVGIFVGIATTNYKFKEYRRKKRYDTMVKRIDAGLPAEEPHIVMDFIKARKAKVCPLINYVEGEK